MRRRHDGGCVGWWLRTGGRSLLRGDGDMAILTGIRDVDVLVDDLGEDRDVRPPRGRIHLLGDMGRPDNALDRGVVYVAPTRADYGAAQGNHVRDVGLGVLGTHWRERDLLAKEPRGRLSG